ncbi:bifunctional biotin--[acetyl-CoA-carboxylase] ligase/biotin operon repressor BirA [Lonepinella koalarum]|uniref:biotin--[biotin carboxyl-carrier protein] ligase n=1 Tax=Lonepinella koalarum TaxID=53417 RepID=A0A4R1KYS9_9PAST|nr:bifunctional biotin--[acetyl-CoA-carboxylase] ligase/biotin operon repressor BirA [Lonepinella koalarum]MDH2927595.1 bifunctional biotin operon repressor/biotin--[acetyl-CoA-carboxylase] ligase [Lonepinella koalarum]TCK69787.1 BirA family biotin operon repressor/biotin-[acetyl-CoA-carboxylase] ligase [Lonepinella koalarum]TFJ90601.1 bifunctional biotin--[acetyl-CoA-carboxylase] ligase/biotin operon repressor BirA [Lonepinella koalarum]
MYNLLEKLADGQTYSFENLTALLGCNDNELLVQIQQLQQQGIHIDTTLGEVKLLPQTALLNPEKLRDTLPNQVFYRPIIHSTNQFLLENIKRLNKGDICTAESQTAGRGRRGRQWISPFASQLMFSFIWQVDARKPIDGLSSIVAMAINHTLIKLGGADIMLKWPNDILLKGRKLAGILIEIAHTENGQLNLVVGIGLNVDIPKDNQQIDQSWANLTEILPKIDRTSLLIALIQQIYQELETFERVGINAEFQQKWQEVDAYFGETVNIITEKQVISGTEQGIDEHGYLKLLTNSGELLTFNGGEVSLRRK